MTSVGLAGFGSAGRGIHAPLLQEAGMMIVAVSTADPQRAQHVHDDAPGARVVADLDALLGVAGLDLIVLATPSGLHAGQARQCIDAGIAVVVDKPLATDATRAFGVVDAARAAGVAMTVFQNRRFDAEHVAARETVRSGRLGEVFRHEFRWERWRPMPKDRWRENASAAEGGGILLDLHSHMVDAAVDLFGPIDMVYAEIAARTTASEDDAFLACRHTSGVMSHLGATSLSAAPGPRVRILRATRCVRTERVRGRWHRHLSRPGQRRRRALWMDLRGRAADTGAPTCRRSGRLLSPGEGSTCHAGSSGRHAGRPV